MKLPFSVDMFYEFRKPCTSTEDLSSASAYPSESFASALAPTPNTVRDTLPTVSEDAEADFEIDTGGVKPSVKGPAPVSATEGTNKSDKPGWFKSLNLRYVSDNADTYQTAMPNVPLLCAFRCKYKLCWLSV